MNKWIDRSFLPDLYCNDIYDITPDTLKAHGIRALIMDIDNTLVTYDDPVPTEEVRRWLDGMVENGVKIALVSNNSSRERVRKFNEPLGFFASAKSGKPGKREMRKALLHLGTAACETGVVGDQVFTDIFAGKRMGMYSILVKPIRDKTSWFFRCKRKLEIPVLKRYDTKNRKETSK